MILIIANTDVNSGFNFFENENFTLFDCKDIYRRKEDGSNIAKKDIEEYYADEIVKAIDLKDNTKAEAIIIDKHLGTTDFGRAILIAGHIATHKYSNSELDQLPVIISSWSEIIISELKEMSISNLFAVQGVFAKTYAELFQIVKSATGEQEYKITQFLRKNRIPVHWQDFKINYSFDDRHQIANEWGAVKLALNAGYNKEDIKYDWPPTLYFKYLLKKHESQILTKEERLAIIEKNIDEWESIASAESLLQDGKLKFSNHPYLRNKKVLLIDDNADKGWEVILKNIFGGSPFVVKTDFEQVNQFGNLLDINKYDLVFLDLRLPKILLKDVQLEHGIDLLDKLKFAYPHIPLIVFTASNKSWTLDEANERGADGMYVKESPEYGGDDKYSKENFESFVKTVLKCMDSYHIMRPYWEMIRDIENNPLEIFYKSQKMNRIIERLKMFYGLLKRGKEQRNFDEKMFHFSDYELAFITLWSTLNEISSAFYKKIKENNSVKFEETHHPDESIIEVSPEKIENHFVWQIKNQRDKLFQFELRIKKDKSGKKIIKNDKYQIVEECVTKIAYDRFNQSGQYYNLADNFFNPTKTLHIQIAFLLLCQNDLKGSTKAERHLSNLKNLNDKRNSLFLTHDSYDKDNFRTEREKRNQDHKLEMKQSIKELFELVAFLLTGKEMELKF